MGGSLRAPLVLAATPALVCGCSSRLHPPPWVWEPCDKRNTRRGRALVPGPRQSGDFAEEMMSRQACTECGAMLHWRVKGEVCPSCRGQSAASEAARKLRAARNSKTRAISRARTQELRAYRQMLELKKEGVSERDIGRTTRKSRSTVQRWLAQGGPHSRRAKQRRTDAVPEWTEAVLIERAGDTPILTRTEYAEWLNRKHGIGVSAQWVDKVLVRSGRAAEIREVKPVLKGLSRLPGVLDRALRRQANAVRAAWARLPRTFPPGNLKTMRRLQDERRRAEERESATARATYGETLRADERPDSSVLGMAHKS